jgi:hypothetical protein
MCAVRRVLLILTASLFALIASGAGTCRGGQPTAHGRMMMYMGRGSPAGPPPAGTRHGCRAPIAPAVVNRGLRNAILKPPHRTGNVPAARPLAAAQSPRAGRGVASGSAQLHNASQPTRTGSDLESTQRAREGITDNC